MKLFTIKQGTGAILCTKTKDMPNREQTPLTHEAELWITRKDLTLEREELLVDPVSLPSIDTVRLCKDLERKGYGRPAINAVMNNVKKCMVFERDGYMLIVSAECVQVK